MARQARKRSAKGIENIMLRGIDKRYIFIEKVKRSEQVLKEKLEQKGIIEKIKEVNWGRLICHLIDFSTIDFPLPRTLANCRILTPNSVYKRLGDV